MPRDHSNPPALPATRRHRELRVAPGRGTGRRGSPLRGDQSQCGVRFDTALPVLNPSTSGRLRSIVSRAGALASHGSPRFGGWRSRSRARGLNGLLSHSVARTRKIGLRMALGAPPQHACSRSTPANHARAAGSVPIDQPTDRDDPPGSRRPIRRPTPPWLLAWAPSLCSPRCSPRAGRAASIRSSRCGLSNEPPP